MREVGIAQPVTSSARFPDASIQALWLRAPEYARRPGFELFAARLYRPGMFFVLDELVGSAGILREAFVRGASHLRLLHDVAELRLIDTTPLARIELQPSLPPPMPPALSEFFLGCLTIVARKLSGVHEHPRRLAFVAKRLSLGTRTLPRRLDELGTSNSQQGQSPGELRAQRDVRTLGALATRETEESERTR